MRGRTSKVFSAPATHVPFVSFRSVAWCRAGLVLARQRASALGEVHPVFSLQPRDPTGPRDGYGAEMGRRRAGGGGESGVVSTAVMRRKPTSLDSLQRTFGLH